MAIGGLGPRKILHIYDLDHTLVHTDELLVPSHTNTFRQVFHVDIPEEVLRRHFGEDISVFVRNLCTDVGVPFRGDEVSRYLHAWETNYIGLAKKGRDIQIAKGVPECLLGEGIVRVIATCSTYKIAEEVLRQSGLYGYFESITGGVEGIRKVDLVRQSLADAVLNHGTFEFKVAIGDGSGEIRGGKVIGAYCVGLLTGRATEPELREAGADLVLPSLVEAEFRKIPKEYRIA